MIWSVIDAAKENPRPRTPLPRARLIDLIREHEQGERARPYQMKLIFAGKSAPCLVASIAELSPIILSEMMVGKTHTGRFLLCRTVMPSFADGEVETVIEDLTGEAEIMLLFNFQDSLSGDPNGWLPKGQILIIKEPLLIHDPRFATERLTCDSPSDVVFIDSWNTAIVGGTPWYRANTLSFDEAKAKGNNHFGKNEFDACLRMYDLALQLRPHHPIILLNRAAVLLHLDRNFEAFESAKLALESKSTELNREKLFYRLATAAYRLRDWDSATTYYSILVDFNQTNTDFADGFQRAQARLAESKTGVFDIRTLSEQVADAMDHNTVCQVDAADYVGPIHIVDIPGKGKGVVASREVKRGTLLMAAKPLAWPSPDPGLRKIGTIFHWQLQHTFPLPANNMMLSAVRFVCKNPHRASDVYSLWDGKPRSEKTLPSGVIDAHRIRRIAQINSFEAPHTFVEILNDPAIGLYDLPSYLNHSCTPNAHRFFYGDLIMIYAVTDLACGEEVTIDYLGAADDMNRQRRFQASFGFQCCCPMCVEQSRNPFLDQRSNICTRIEEVQARKATRSTLRELERLLGQLEETYQNDKYRVNLVTPLTELADSYVPFKEHKKAVLAFRKAFACCTVSSPVGPFRIVWYAKAICLASNSVNDEYVIPMKNEMLDFVRVYCGASSEVFFEVWVPALMKQQSTDLIDLILPFRFIETEADLLQTREVRRACWVGRLLTEKTP